MWVRMMFTGRGLRPGGLVRRQDGEEPPQTVFIMWLWPNGTRAHKDIHTTHQSTNNIERYYRLYFS